MIQDQTVCERHVRPPELPLITEVLALALPLQRNKTIAMSNYSILLWILPIHSSQVHITIAEVSTPNNRL